MAGSHPAPVCISHARHLAQRTPAQPPLRPAHVAVKSTLPCRGPQLSRIATCISHANQRAKSRHTVPIDTLKPCCERDPAWADYPPLDSGWRRAALSWQCGLHAVVSGVARLQGATTGGGKRPGGGRRQRPGTRGPAVRPCCTRSAPPCLQRCPSWPNTAYLCRTWKFEWRWRRPTVRAAARTTAPSRGVPSERDRSSVALFTGHAAHRHGRARKPHQARRASGATRAGASVVHGTRTAEMSWSKADAYMKAKARFSTLLTAHRPMFWLNERASLNLRRPCRDSGRTCGGGTRAPPVKSQKSSAQSVCVCGGRGTRQRTPRACSSPARYPTAQRSG